MRQLALLAASVAAVWWGAGCSSKPGATVAASNRPPVAAVAAAPSAAQPSNELLTGGTTPAPVVISDPVIARIRDEGLNRSQVMEHLDVLTNVIGPRLTGSPNMRRANEWTRDTLAQWGFSNSRLESWGPFGRGWEVRRFAFQITEPTPIILTGYPRAWSPGLTEPAEAQVVHLDPEKDGDLDAYKGKLKGKIVLLGSIRAIEPRFEPMATRLTPEQLAEMSVEAAARAAESEVPPGMARGLTAGERRAQMAQARPGAVPATQAARGQTFEMTSGPTTNPARGRRAFNPRSLRMFNLAASEGALAVITPSNTGDGGTVAVQAATLPGDINPTEPGAPRPRPWAKDAPVTPPQVTIAAEDFNRLARIIRRGELPKARLDLQVAFHDRDLNCYNTIAEIPGTDPNLKDEIVMVGAHMDSWHSGSGTTDNAVGVASVLEAVRIIKALDLKPRRTIRVALWSGEEQGLYGSSGFVKDHLGEWVAPAQTAPTPPTPATPQRSAPVGANGTPMGGAGMGDAEWGETTKSGVYAQGDWQPVPTEGATTQGATRPTSRPAPRVLTRKAEYEKFSVYFNLDNGAGKIRGIYAQGNSAAVPLFSKWAKDVTDLGAGTVTLRNTGSTDHIPFNEVGLPGFQFIQDSLEYFTRTWHTNQDFYDRAPAGDMKHNATVIATFLWQAANMDDRFPRKPLPERPERQ